jgi:hypothetical protein
MDNHEETRILEIERGRTRSLSVKNSLWKKLWIWRKTDCGVSKTCYFITDYGKGFLRLQRSRLQEDEGTKFLRNAGDRLSSYAASHPGRTQSSTTPA